MLMMLNTLIDERIRSMRFCCDLSRCKGACCTFEGGSGAPLLSEEVPIIETLAQQLFNHLSHKAQHIIQQYGAIQRSKQSVTIRCIENRECIFVIYDGTIARCAIEDAYHHGLTEFRKPLSCHLFPIRVTEGLFPIVHYEKIPECAAGWKKGERENILLLDTVKEALIRRFGHRWYSALRSQAVIQQNNDK